jgi:hypothetical protein
MRRCVFFGCAFLLYLSVAPDRRGMASSTVPAASASGGELRRAQVMPPRVVPCIVAPCPIKE